MMLEMAALLTALIRAEPLAEPARASRARYYYSRRARRVRARGGPPPTAGAGDAAVLAPAPDGTLPADAPFALRWRTHIDPPMTTETDR